ncbi:MAG: hypothetical protein ACYSYV_06460 [Planctomycetota bacterium]|jgi:hypothetical protein
MIGAMALVGAYILGVWWCYEVIRRFPQDVKEIFQLKQISRTVAIVFVWAVTVPIALVLIVYGFVMVCQLISFVRTL